METPVLTPEQGIARLVLDHPECAEVFQRHHIDFCCRGNASLQAAAREKAIPLAALVDELSQAIAHRRDPGQADPRALTTPQLIDHIVTQHHQYLRRALPFVQGLAAKVSRVHGKRNPKLHDLSAKVSALSESLLSHLDEEEGVLFPALTSGGPDERAAKLLASMLAEHLAVAALLEQIRSASDEFVVPEWGCNSYRVLCATLEQLERDTFTHVHLENHVLLPRFRATV